MVQGRSLQRGSPRPHYVSIKFGATGAKGCQHETHTDTHTVGTGRPNDYMR